MGKPKIRFKGFDNDWEQRKFSDIAETRRGLTYKPTNIVDNGIRVLRSSNINEDTFVYGNDDVFVDENVVNIPCVQNGDILITSANGSSRLVGKHAIIRNLHDNSAVHGGFMLIASSSNSEFLNASMGSQWYSEFLSLYVAGGNGAIGNLNKNDLDMQVVFVPRAAEQCQIGIYFRTLDHLITLHQRKCEDTKKLKKYMLQKMFPQNGSKVPEIRLKGFTDDWEQRKLENFGKATGGTSIESEFSEEGVYKVISIGSYSENSLYNDQGIRAIKSDKTSNRVLSRNDLTMILNDKTTSGNIIGRVLLIEESGIYVYNQRTERIEINVDEYDPVFLYEMLNAPNIREKIIKQAQGNTQIYVNWSTISLLDYMIPSKEEQVKIGEYLHNLSNLITLHQNKCDELKKIKKYMLQNMFV